jgi:hypothetical protein
MEPATDKFSVPAFDWECEYSISMLWWPSELLTLAGKYEFPKDSGNHEWQLPSDENAMELFPIEATPIELCS